MSANAIEEVLNTERIAKEKIQNAQMERDRIFSSAEEEARIERDTILNKARLNAQKIIENAKAKGIALSEGIQLDAQKEIEEIENVSEALILKAVNYIEEEVMNYGNR